VIASAPAGDAALLIDTGDPASLAAAINAARLDGVADLVPGAQTVLVITEPGSWDLAQLASLIAALQVPAALARDRSVAEIPVVYDGPDLADVAHIAGMSVAEVIARHQAGEYTVGWLGFSPGFGYLTGLDPKLRDVPRLDRPRLAVPAGSVAIAGGLAAVYPAASPGGWRLLGRTSARLWDPDGDPPALLAPGMAVRFRAASGDQPAQASGQTGRAGPATGHAGQAIGRADRSADAARAQARTGRLEVVRPGPLATVQDFGRPGLGSQGVPPSGAADVASMRLANRLAGNPDGAACIELTLGRAVFRCAGAIRLAVAGAPVRVTIAAGPGMPGHEAGFGAAADVPDGATVSIGPPAAGLRSYLAVTGGVDVPAVLGSRSSDLHSGLGGGPLRPGDVLPVGTGRQGANRAPSSASGKAPSPCPRAQPARRRAIVTARTSIPDPGETVCLRLVPGPRLDWFGADAPAILSGNCYTVTMASNRTGLRLAGPALPRARDGELPSEGMVTGALQVPHDGLPILLLADHPSTGGYPVIAVVASADLGLAAQLRPGQRLRFRIG
jgi:KipI family sensor histidine kinase inhibitor